ncbi:KRAB-A domain containing-like protein, partial [Daphnia magna]
MTTDVHLTSYEVEHSAGENHLAVVSRVKLNTVEDLQSETSNFYDGKTYWVSSDGDVDNNGGLEIPLKIVNPGHYHHLGIANGILQMLFKLKIINLSNPTIKLIVNIDGIPIAKSSGSQFWPILGLIVDILNSKPFLIGIYHGH